MTKPNFLTISQLSGTNLSLTFQQSAGLDRLLLLTQLIFGKLLGLDILVPLGWLMFEKLRLRRPGAIELAGFWEVTPGAARPADFTFRHTGTVGPARSTYPGTVGLADLRSARRRYPGAIELAHFCKVHPGVPGAVELTDNGNYSYTKCGEDGVETSSRNALRVLQACECYRI